jgi:solute carrier family 8 (sodium/calcium exchanger)
VSAVQDPYADNAVGNVTGSNGVNVFLGIGIAWTICAVYHFIIGTPGGFHVSFHHKYCTTFLQLMDVQVEPGTLAFSVTVFSIEALLCIAVLLARRHPAVGGELGGPMKYRLPTTIFFTMLWVAYITISALESYCVIQGF